MKIKKLFFLKKACDFFNYIKKCDKISKIMHDNFYKDREFALDVIEIKEVSEQDESNKKEKSDISLKFNVKILLLKI